MKFDVGDVVVYASHGIGRVESTYPADGPSPGGIVLVFDGGMKVTLPLERAQDSLRHVSGEADLETIRRTLGAAVEPSDGSASQRNRQAQEKLVVGDVGGLAEIVREGVLRERRIAANSRSGGATDSRVYRSARKLLAAEIAASRGIAPEAADAWILQQVDEPA